MLQGWVFLAVALGYIGLLFLIASYGDCSRRKVRDTRARLLIYPLSLAIYCTSWTFFGSVGLASRTGFDFLTIYIGPILMIGLFWPLLMRMVRLAKAQNITSIADFIAARYGKSQRVAACVAMIAIIGSIPYIALQLKAVSASLQTVTAQINVDPGSPPVFGDISLFVAMAMATFAVLFGTRHVDATEHQDGLMLAIATESTVKLIAFLAVGVFVTFWMFDGPVALFTEAMQIPRIAAILTRDIHVDSWLAMTLLSFFAFVLIPRQFHVAVVENNNVNEVKRAAWLFPAYLVLINLFVIPIAIAGLIMFPVGRVDSDMFVLALPLAAGSHVLALAAFVGGLSAATAMVIVETVALSIMVSNDIVMPFLLNRRAAAEGPDNLGSTVLKVRRLAIFCIMVLAYLYYRSAGDAQLAAIGLLSFAAVAQLAPAFVGGLIWRRATASGAIAGMAVGFAVWAYTLLLPSIADAGLIAPDLLTAGPWNIAALRPQHLFGLDLPPLVHGVMWSLALNMLAFVGFTLRRRPAPIEQLQANLFVPTELAPIAPTFRLWRSTVAVEELIATVARYLGEERTRTSFENFAHARRINLDPKADADMQLLRYAEHLLASAIGTASSRLVLSLLLRKPTVSTKAALKLLDDANAAIQYNREILQTALDHVRQGIAVFDKEMQLICWNRQFGDVLDLPPALTRAGVRLDDILRYNAARDTSSPEVIEKRVHTLMERYTEAGDAFIERFAERGLFIEVRANRMPDGGIATTFTDMTPSVEAAEALEKANETLERRVRERTEELTRLNAALARAKRDAEEANTSKTRFLAAASHDILQPLNAARLYVTSLVERSTGPNSQLVGNIDASLEAVEEIFNALLDISRLDAGVLRPEPTSFRIDQLLRQIEVEFAPIASSKGLELVFVPSQRVIRSDRRMLRRLLQNLVSNAIKYTPKGRVLVGCRLCGDQLRIDVFDTGVGIPESQHKTIFAEFHRLDQGARIARGLGLGLSIVERIARVLQHEINMDSKVGHGTHFSITVPLSDAPPAHLPITLQPESDASQLAGTVAVCIDNEPAILDGMETLLGGWGCRVIKAADAATALEILEQEKLRPNGLLVDYHLDRSNGIAAIARLRQQLGEDLPAILITADRGPRVRDEARTHGIQVLNKPLRPAALRALLAQWRVQRIAAAE